MSCWVGMVDYLYFTFSQNSVFIYFILRSGQHGSILGWNLSRDTIERLFFFDEVYREKSGPSIKSLILDFQAILAANLLPNSLRYVFLGS